MKTALLVDFDNTITRGDILDSVIQTFSPTTEWMAAQDAWCQGRISTLECLQRQMAGLDVDESTLLEYAGRAQIDPGFVRLQRWAASTDTPLAIVSDNFEPIVREVLRRNGIPAAPVYANALAFDGRRVLPSFPYRSADCARCANCKATHFARFAGRRIVYVGDGLSDVCPAMRADRVFAKDALAQYLDSQGRAYTAFRSLEEVADALWADRDPVPLHDVDENPSSEPHDRNRVASR